MGLDICIREAERLLKQKDDIKEELEKNRQATCSVITDSYVLKIFIFEKEGKQ